MVYFWWRHIAGSFRINFRCVCCEKFLKKCEIYRTHNKNTDDIYDDYAVSIAQEASLWSLTAEDPVLSCANPCGICGGRSCTGTDFCPSTSVFPCQINCTNALPISIYTLLLPEGRAGEAWEPSKTQCCFGNLGTFGTEELSFGLYRPRRLFWGSATVMDCVLSRVCPCGICGGQNGTGTGSSSIT
jgi:hypothetical protein